MTSTTPSMPPNTDSSTSPPPRFTRNSRSQRSCSYMYRPWWYFLTLLLLLNHQSCVRAQQDPSTLNGGSLLAMAGTNCVALAVDKRFGSGPALVNIGPRSVLAPSPTVLVGFTGLQGDVQSLQHELTALVASQRNRGLGFMTDSTKNKMAVSPKVMASLTSHVLYGRKQAPYYVEPLVIGLEPDIAATAAVADAIEKSSESSSSAESLESRIQYRPFLCSMDMIGATSESEAFVCAGAASKSLFGTAEALWEPDMDEERLLQVCGRAFLGALERDCLSGYGAIVYMITKNGIVEYDLAGRND